MSAAGELAAGGTIVDCPAGRARRCARSRPEANYVGVDLSPSMLRRARERATRRGLVKAEFIEADAAAISLPTDFADLLFSFWGLHCFPDPAAAMLEAARILKPGGRPSVPASSAAPTPFASASSSAPMSATSARSAPNPRSNPGSPTPAST